MVYAPENGNPREWDIDVGKLLSPERIAIEKLTGMTWGEWKIALSKDSVIAMHALLYVLLKRNDPTLTPGAVQFTEDEIAFEVSDSEAADIIEHFRQNPTDDPSVTELLKTLRAQVGGEPEAPKEKKPKPAKVKEAT